AIDHCVDELSGPTHIRHLLDLAHGVRELAARRVEALNRADDDSCFPIDWYRDIAGSATPPSADEPSTELVWEAQRCYYCLDVILQLPTALDGPRGAAA